jgi:hypothetical protein
MVEIKPGDAEYAEKCAQAVSIRDSSPDIDAEWQWSGSKALVLIPAQLVF